MKTETRIVYPRFMTSNCDCYWNEECASCGPEYKEFPVINGNFDELKEITHILMSQIIDMRKHASDCREESGNAMATLANIDQGCADTIDQIMPRLLKLIEE